MNTAAVSYAAPSNRRIQSRRITAEPYAPYHAMEEGVPRFKDLRSFDLMPGPIIALRAPGIERRQRFDRRHRVEITARRELATGFHPTLVAAMAFLLVMSFATTLSRTRRSEIRAHAYIDLVVPVYEWRGFHRVPRTP